MHSSKVLKKSNNFEDSIPGKTDSKLNKYINVNKEYQADVNFLQIYNGLQDKSENMFNTTRGYTENKDSQHE